MIVYKKNNDAMRHEASTVSKVHTQVCMATLIAANTTESDELMLFLEDQFKKGITDHKRLVDMGLALINVGDRVKRKAERPS